MSRWLAFAGLADKYRDRPFHVILANPFAFNESVYPKVEKAAAKAGLTGRRKNFTFHRRATHPLVDRRGPEMVPGWNASNSEINANGKRACYALFDRQGQLVFRGRLTFEEVEARVRELLDRPSRLAR